MIRRKTRKTGTVVLLALAMAVAGWVVSSRAPWAAGQEPAPKAMTPQEKLAELLTFDVTQPKGAGPGNVVNFTIKGKLKPGYHTFPITKLGKDQDQQTEPTYQPNAFLQPLWPIQEKDPKFYKEGDGSTLMELEDGFTWTQDVYIKPTAKPGEQTLSIKLKVQVCNDHGCYGPAVYPEPILVKVNVLDGPAVQPSPDLEKRLKVTKQPDPEEVPVPKDAPTHPKLEVTKAPGQKKSGNEENAGGGIVVPGKTNGPGGQNNRIDTSLVALLGSAFLGAILMLLTPCVFPMIPITVNFFLKQSEKEHHNALPTALVYSGTIVVLLTAAMLTLGTVVIYVAASPVFNLILGVALIAFALSLFGMYELELPSGLARFTSAREGQGGYVGAIFMALTFTITSFTCTGPFLGAMMGPIAALQPPYIYLVLAALVYSVTFAAPFFLLALFPTLLKALPKSGGWLNSIKVTMGFLELAAALKFLANTDIALSPGNPRFFNYDTVLCAWIALSIACGLYLFGVFRLPHDDRVEHIGALRMIFASIFIGLALYMFPLLLGGKPAGVVSEALVAFLPPQLKEAGPNTGGKSSELAWYPDYMEAWTQAVNEGKLIFIDFTGVTCTNCRYNEQNVFPKSEVVSQLKNYVRVRLFVDSVPNPKLTWTEAREQAARNETWRNTVARSPANPTYLIFQPDPKEPFTKDGVIKGVAVSTTDGAIYDIAEFVDFLKKPLDAKAASQAKSTSSSWHRDYKKAWEEATKENRLIFVNFTGIMNTNCRYNEVNVLNKQEVTARLQAYARLQLFCDRLPDEKLPPDQSQKQVKWNEEWRGEMAQGWYPTYIVFKPDPQKTLTADGWPKGEVLETCGGQIADVPGFVALFDNPGKGKKAIGTASSH